MSDDSNRPDPIAAKWITLKRKPRHQGRYISLAIASWMAFEILLNASVQRGKELPSPNFMVKGEWLVPVDTLNADEWAQYTQRPDVYVGTTFLLFTSGTSTTLPSDWNPGANTVSGIGAGGSGGFSGAANQLSSGGGGGAFSSITNYSAAALSVVEFTVGAGDTTWGSACVLVAKAGSAGGVNGGPGGSGGQASSGVGSTKFSGGNGGNCNLCGRRSGGGGGGAAGPGGGGFSGATPPLNTGGNGGQGGAGSGGAGGTGGPLGGTGGTNGSNGTDIGDGAGSGGGGGGGAGAWLCGFTQGIAGDGGAYGGGGGGGGLGISGGGGGNGGGGGGGGGGGDPCHVAGFGFQGVIVISYTPFVAAAPVGYSWVQIL